MPAQPESARGTRAPDHDRFDSEAASFSSVAEACLENRRAWARTAIRLRSATATESSPALVRPAPQARDREDTPAGPAVTRARSPRIAAVRLSASTGMASAAATRRAKALVLQ